MTHTHQCRICWRFFDCTNRACLDPKADWAVCPKCYACETFDEAAKDWPEFPDAA